MALRSPGPREKAAWAAAAFLLMALEIFAIRHDRQEQEDRHIKELADERQRFQDSLNHLGIIETGVQGIPRIQGEISKIKPNVTVLPPPTFGNLKERCNILAANITALVKHRFDQLQKSPAYAQPLTAEKMREWNRSNDAEFRDAAFGSPVQTAKELRNELAQLHIREARLDAILDRDNKNIKLAEADQQGWPEFRWMNIYNMEEIARRISVLANQIH